MPVVDHDVHELTKVGEGHRYGCHNRPARKKFYYAWDWIGYEARVVRVGDRSSTECRYDMSLTDPACEGCIHRGSGEAYSQSIREATTK